MREKDEREGVENGGRKGGKSHGYVHRLDQVATSYFFTNFSDDIKAVDLWPKFARFGRVWEVYIPSKLDKQGRRFGFVKFRDIKNAREQLDLISNIWVGSYKLRVNLPKFEKGSTKKDPPKEDQVSAKVVPESSKQPVGVRDDGRTFMTALLKGPVQQKEGKALMEANGCGDSEDAVVWEVEIEAEVVSKLNGSFVGYLLEHKDHLNIQQNFLMGGYPKIRIIPLGHLQVLISSDVVGEVQEVVGSVGWWCNWFDRFEAWSPDLVTNQRDVWLSCFGVPLHAWGDAIFKTIGSKFGTFIQVDVSTKNLLRGDVARIKIVTSLKEVVDTTVCVSVMGKKFKIRVMEEVGQAEEGGAVSLKRPVPELDDHSQDGSEAGGFVDTVGEEFSEEGSDGDWSENGQLVQKVEGQQRRQGCVTFSRKKGDVGVEESEVDPHLFGNTLTVGNSNVNKSLVDIGNQELESCRALVVVPEVTDGIVGNVFHAGCLGNKEDGESMRPRAQGEGEFTVSDPGPLGVDIGIGPLCYQPLVLRTKDGDIPFCCNLGGADGNCSEVNNKASLGLCSSDPLDQMSQEDFSGL
ncbi:zinc finger CCCH domain-containing protein [Trifolium repens]|nr:zinc finger CCCH domain-containing protein [Trifolium repens]